MTKILHDLLFDYTLRHVALGSAILGIVSGALGSFAVLRKQSLLGDSISHAALPGIALAFLLTGSKAPVVVILGAAASGWIGTYFIISIVRNTQIKEDTAQGIVLSVFFGLGLVLLTYIQRLSTSAKSGLDKFLFGQAATLMTEDIITMSVVGIITLSILVIFWKEFKLLTFDQTFLESIGYPVKSLEILLTFLIVASIVIGLQTVGVVLMSAMVIAPAIAARQWTDKLGIMVILSGLFGALAGVSGALISSSFSNLPTGPTIVVTLTMITLISLLLAGHRGLIWAYLRQYNQKKIYASDKILEAMFFLAKKHKSVRHPHGLKTLQTISGLSGVKSGLIALESRKYIEIDKKGRYFLTEKGYAKAEARMKYNILHEKGGNDVAVY
ncbi:MAG: metal ABC transporter permease [Spirochaetes bacterium]|nr:metal ABC transporter permease [Spirochaetota bacterium]